MNTPTKKKRSENGFTGKIISEFSISKMMSVLPSVSKSTTLTEKSTQISHEHMS